MMKVAALQIVLLCIYPMASGCLNSERVLHLTTPECKSDSWQQYPSLRDATTDTLQEGLESGQFTSVDLVKVCMLYLLDLEIYPGSYSSNF